MPAKLNSVEFFALQIHGKSDIKLGKTSDFNMSNLKDNLEIKTIITKCLSKNRIYVYSKIFLCDILTEAGARGTHSLYASYCYEKTNTKTFTDKL